MYSPSLPQNLQSNRDRKKQERLICPIAIIPHIESREIVCKCHGITLDICETPSGVLHSPLGPPTGLGSIQQVQSGAKKDRVRDRTGDKSTT